MNTFSAEVKKELSEINNLANKNLVKAELIGYLSTNSSNSFSTKNQYNINRYSKLLNNVGEDDFNISIKGNNFQIKTKNEVKYIISGVEEVYNALDEHSQLIASALSSRHVADIRNIVEEWDNTLNSINNIIEEWLLVQKQWIYLENIFTSPM